MRETDEPIGALVARLAKARHGERGVLLPLLHDIQHELGRVDDETVAAVAQTLNLSRAEVHGVVSFYHDFRKVPAGRHIVQYCRAESCQSRGGAAIEAALAERLLVAMGATRADGQVTLEPVYCLGLCAVGPNALVDGAPVARIDGDAAIERIAATVAA